MFCGIKKNHDMNNEHVASFLKFKFKFAFTLSQNNYFVQKDNMDLVNFALHQNVLFKLFGLCMHYNNI